MGFNLIPFVTNFRIAEQEFQLYGFDGSVEDGCISEGWHRILRFDLYCINIGDRDLFLGTPQERPDIFEWSSHGHFHLKEFNNYNMTKMGNVEEKFTGVK